MRVVKLNNKTFYLPYQKEKFLKMVDKIIAKYIKDVSELRL